MSVICPVDGQQKDDTIRPDGRQDKKRRDEGRHTELKKTQKKRVFLCPAGGPRTIQDTYPKEGRDEGPKKRDNKTKKRHKNKTNRNITYH